MFHGEEGPLFGVVVLVVIALCVFSFLTLATVAYLIAHYRQRLSKRAVTKPGAKAPVE